jgi:peptide/nickel transport system substrate-binding protein
MWGVLAALALVAGACGGDDDDAVDDDGGEATVDTETGDTDTGEADTSAADTGEADTGEATVDTDSGEADSGEADSGAADTSEADDDGAPATTDDSGSSGDGEFAPSGTLQVGVSTNVQSYDAQMAAVAQEYYLHPVYDTLVHGEPDGSYAAGLAESWEFPDRTTLTMSIRPDVTFSDGTPVDAAAVAANFERGKTIEASPSAGFYANIESAEVVDARTVQLNLVAPSTSLLDDLSRLPGMMMSPASFEGDPGTAPIGAGGWTLDANASNPGEVQVYQANPDYWDPSRIKVETVEMRVLEPDAATNALLAGQIHIGELRSEADISTFEGDEFELITRPNANVWYIQIMDTDGSLLEPMGDVRVRQALNLAIDRDAFNEGLQFGEGDASPSFWLPETGYYDESLEEWAYDPARASELLAEAGYADGFSVTFPSFGAIVPVAESVQQMWAEIGVDVTVELVEPGTLAAVMRNGETVMTPTIARGFTAESHYKERLAPGGPYDPIGTDRGDLASLAEAAYQSETQEAQEAAWSDLYAYAIDEGYMMVIGHSFPRVVAADGIEGAVLRPSDNIPQMFDITVDG